MERAITILTLCLLLLGSAQTARAQVTGRSGNGLQGRISGTVVDAGTTDPIVSATVGVWRMNDSTLVTGAVTQENGRFPSKV